MLHRLLGTTAKLIRLLLGHECDNCGSHRLEDNGHGGYGRAYLCVDCDYQIDASSLAEIHGACDVFDELIASRHL